MKAVEMNYGFWLLLIAILAISCSLSAAEKADKDGDVTVTLQDLPAAVKATLVQAAGTGTIQELEKEKSGIYSADIFKDGVKYDVEIAADGKLIKNEVDKEDNERDDDKECKQEEEVKVTIDQLPAAVAETIRKEAGNGTIGEIERETEDGRTVYSAEITKEGKKLEVEVAEDGKLLEVEEDD